MLTYVTWTGSGSGTLKSRNRIRNKFFRIHRTALNPVHYKDIYRYGSNLCIVNVPVLWAPMGLMQSSVSTHLSQGVRRERRRAGESTSSRQLPDTMCWNS